MLGEKFGNHNRRQINDSSSYGPQAVAEGTRHAEQSCALQSPDLGKPSPASPLRSFHVLGHLYVFFVEMFTEIPYQFLMVYLGLPHFNIIKIFSHDFFYHFYNFIFFPSLTHQECFWYKDTTRYVQM